MRVKGDRMSPLSSGIMALIVSATLTGCLSESARSGDRAKTEPSTDRSASENQTTEHDATKQFGLVQTPIITPSPDDMWKARAAVAFEKLKMITSIAHEYVIGYHKPTSYNNEQVEALDYEFLEAFHGSKYEEIGNLKARFQALIPQNNPAAAHPKVLARMAFLNLWELLERYRDVDAEGNISNPQVLAQNIGACSEYFRAASEANSSYSVYRGFAAICTMLWGQSGAPNTADKLALGLEWAGSAIRHNPDFNLFTVGYTLSASPVDSEQFKLGVEMLWRNLDVCFGDTLDRKNPNVAKYIPTFIPVGNKRFCLNSEVAPHNFEGFALIFGDMLVKANQVEAAKVMYANAKLLPSYQTWPARFRDILEERLAKADDLVRPFQAPVDPLKKPNYPTITINSEYSCMVCHQGNND